MVERSRDEIGPEPEESVDRAWLYQSWNVATWFHWPYEPASIEHVVPKGLELDTFEGKAYVGLVPFLIENQRLAGTPAVPWLSTARETHLRTYVTSSDGRRGSLFFYLENARLAGVLAAQLGFGLRYVWSSLGLERDGDRVTYTGKRLVPPFTEHRIEVEVGDPFAEGELGALDHFLTAQWVLFTEHLGRLLAVLVEHPPWPIYRANVLRLDQRLFDAAGIPRPAGEPLVHYSPGVDAKVGMPERVPR